MPAVTEQRVTVDRERELLKRGNVQDFLSLKQKSKQYKETLQKESLEGLPEYLQIIYKITDSLGITSPDTRLKQRLELSEASCTKQRLLAQQYEKRIEEQERLILDKEQELRDCEFCYEKRKQQILQGEKQLKALVQEKENYLQLLKQNQDNGEAAELVSKISSQIVELNHKQRVLERERNEFASRIVESDSAVIESENTLVSLGIYSAVLQKSYIRSRIEIMRLQPLLFSSSSPIETIDSLVEDQRISEQTERIADAMSYWVADITSDISEVAIRAKKRQSLYDSLKGKRKGSVSEVTNLAEKIIHERQQRYGL